MAVPNQPTSGIPSQTPIYSVSKDSLSFKTKQLATLELPGIFYNQCAPTAANCDITGAVSVVGANYIGQAQTGTSATGAATAVTYVSATGVFTIATAGWMPTTLNYNFFPVIINFSGTGAVPTTFIAGSTYYANWVSANTFTLSATIGGTAISGGGTGTTVTVQAATPYWGSPYMPAGFLMPTEGMTTIGYGSNSNFGGVRLHGEILGNLTSAGTGTTLFSAGVIGPTGTYTALTGASTAIAVAAVGPFPFRYDFDLVCQQYGPAVLAGTTFGNLGLIRGSGRALISQANNSGTADVFAVNLWAASQALDLTLGYTLDARFTFGTPAAGTYLEPLSVAFWSYN
jgi:hypothetical protein